MKYTIKVDDKYFKEIIYRDELCKYSPTIYEEDIKEITLTNNIEKTLPMRGVGDIVEAIYCLKQFKDKKISIIPISEKRQLNKFDLCIKHIDTDICNH